MTDYSSKFSLNRFWRTVVRAGRDLAVTAVTLYYAMCDPDTPGWAKATILSALGYLVMPFDAALDFLPGIGFSDDLVVLAGALATVAVYVKPEHRRRAEQAVDGLFGPA